LGGIEAALSTVEDRVTRLQDSGAEEVIVSPVIGSELQEVRRGRSGGQCLQNVREIQQKLHQQIRRRL
jgi:hypothetical protein